MTVMILLGLWMQSPQMMMIHECQQFDLLLYIVKAQLCFSFKPFLFGLLWATNAQ